MAKHSGARVADPVGLIEGTGPPRRRPPGLVPVAAVIMAGALFCLSLEWRDHLRGTGTVPVRLLVLSGGVALAAVLIAVAGYLRRGQQIDRINRKLRDSYSDLANTRMRLGAEIADRTRSEAVAKERATRLQQAVELARLGYYVWDARTNRCEFCTEQLAAAFGLTPKAFRARADGADGSMYLVHPEDRKHLRAAYAELAAGRSLDITYRTNNPAGPRRLRVIARPVMDADGRPLKYHFAALDVTDQHETTARLAEAQRMESIGRMTGGIAHDFNNLLAVILGNLELLGEVKGKAEQQEMISEAMAATLRGRDLTRNMLGFARRAPLDPIELNLKAVVDGMVPLIRRTLPKNIAIRVEADDGLWPVRGDRSLTDSALLNLVINARDAMPRGGTLTIEAHNVDPAAEPGAGCGAGLDPAARYVVLSVADTGTGIDPAIRDRVFKPFVSTKTARSNTGLGLPMVQSFIRQAGGRIELDSLPGQGTTFRLFFRVADEDAVAGCAAGLTCPLCSDA